MTLQSFPADCLLEPTESRSDASRSPRKKDKPFLLKSFGHQVSGRASILCYDADTICKPYVSRELFFYHFLPPTLKEFTPEFRGMINVTFIENSCTGSVLTYAQPKSLLHSESNGIKSFVEKPKPHSKRCVKDFGKTHVMYGQTEIPVLNKPYFTRHGEYPTNPAIRLLKSKSPGGNNVLRLEDDVEKLTHGFDANVSIHSDEGVTTFPDETKLTGETSGQQNPWNSKVIDDAWMKLKTNGESHGNERHTTTAKTKRFVLLENVTRPYRRPCVLDLKMGTRVRENASAAKLARHVTAIDVGARLSGMQIYCPEKHEFLYVNKYCGHNLTVDGLKSKLTEFFSRGMTSPSMHRMNNKGATSGRSFHQCDSSQSSASTAPATASVVDSALVKCAITKLTRLRKAIASLETYRFYSCSVLLIYEGDVSSKPPCSELGEANTGRDPESGGSGSFNFPSPMLGTSRSQAQAVSRIRSKRRLCRPRSLPMPNVASSSRHEDSDSPPNCAPANDKVSALQSKSKASNSRQQQNSPDRGGSGDHRNRALKSSHKRRRRTKSCSSLVASQQQADGKVCGDGQQKISEKTGRKDDLEIRLIDFAHFCFRDSDVHPGPDGGFLFGIDNVVSLLRDMIKQ